MTKCKKCEKEAVESGFCLNCLVEVLKTIPDTVGKCETTMLMLTKTQIKWIDRICSFILILITMCILVVILAIIYKP